jgi:hypothetical protein
MKKLLISGIMAMSIFAISCNQNENSSIQPLKNSLASAKGGVDTTVSGGGSGGGGGGGGTGGTGSNHNPPTTAPTTVFTYAGIFPLPVPSLTNNPIKDAGTVLPTSTWAIKFVVNGVAVTTYNNTPFRFDVGTYGFWNESSADPHSGRNPVGFWYSYATTASYQGSVSLAFCTIDKSFQALVGTYLLNPASTENSVILDRIGSDGHITFYR